MNARIIGSASILLASIALSACGGTSSVPVAPVLNAVPTATPTASPTVAASATPTATASPTASPTATST